MVQTVAQGFKLHLVDYLVDKGILEQRFCLLERDAALTHIEESRIVELTNGRSMGTLHIIGINLQHRLGVHS